MFLFPIPVVLSNVKYNLLSIYFPLEYLCAGIELAKFS